MLQAVIICHTNLERIKVAFGNHDWPTDIEDRFVREMLRDKVPQEKQEKIVSYAKCLGKSLSSSIDAPEKEYEQNLLIALNALIKLADTPNGGLCC